MCDRRDTMASSLLNFGLGLEAWEDNGKNRNYRHPIHNDFEKLWAKVMLFVGLKVQVLCKARWKCYASSSQKHSHALHGCRAQWSRHGAQVGKQYLYRTLAAKAVEILPQVILASRLPWGKTPGDFQKHRGSKTWTKNWVACDNRWELGMGRYKKFMIMFGTTAWQELAVVKQPVVKLG